MHRRIRSSASRNSRGMAHRLAGSNRTMIMLQYGVSIYMHTYFLKVAIVNRFDLTEISWKKVEQ